MYHEKISTVEYTVEAHGRVSPLFCAMKFFFKNKSFPGQVCVISLHINVNRVYLNVMNIRKIWRNINNEFWNDNCLGKHVLFKRILSFPKEPNVYACLYVIHRLYTKC